jgi:demethylmenaquinone methyltransferase/2-methoxy-6-polyprenyl-1,4-benzoquinol methylase
MFDSIAGRYDLLNRVLSGGRDKVWRNRAAGLLPVLRSDARILDLCGGTGDFCLALRRRGLTGHCLIGDLSRPMMALSRPKGVRADLTVMDALSPPLREKSFEVVLCGFGMRNLPNLEAGIRQAYGLLKPGGLFLTLDFFRPEGVVPRFFYHGLAPLFIPFMGWALGSKKTAYVYLVQSVRAFRSVGEYAALCRETGFVQVKTAALDFGIAHAVVAVKES